MTDRLTIGLNRRWLWKCHPLLQKGIYLTIPESCDLMGLLTGPLALTTAYITDRLQTILIDGRPVDDVDSARIHPEARISLSGALPGLAGATLRKGGYYAGLRKSISFDGTAERSGSSRGRVRIKLFNVVLRELGPRLLQEGILVDSADAVDLVETCLAEDNAEAEVVAFNGKPCRWQDVRDQCARLDTLALTVDLRDNPD